MSGRQPGAGPMPLVALLGHAHDALEAAFNQRLQHSEFSDLSLAHTRNVLRHLSPQDPIRASTLASMCGVSKQAVSLQIAQLERTGYLSVCGDPSDRRARQVRLTDRGIQAQAFAVSVIQELDAQWAAAWGEHDWQRVRDRLSQIIEARHTAGD